MPVRSEQDVVDWPGSKGPRAKLSCGDNLDLIQSGPSGARIWMVHVAALRKDRRVGTHPSMSLTQARVRARAIADLARAGIDVLAYERVTEMLGQAKEGVPVQAFGEVAKKYLAGLLTREGVDSQAVNDTLSRMRFLADHPIWLRPLHLLRTHVIVNVLKLFETVHGAEWTEALAQDVTCIVNDAVAREGLAPGALQDIPQTWHSFASEAPPNWATGTVLAPARLGHMLRAIRMDSSSRQIALAFETIAFTVQLPRQVTAMRWVDLDFAARRWHVPQMARFPHVPARDMPLSDHMVAMLGELDRRRSEYVFCSPSKPAMPVSDSSLRKTLSAHLGLAGQFAPSDWRRVFASWAETYLRLRQPNLFDAYAVAFITNEKSASWPPETSEERVRAILQAWAECLDGLIKHAAR